LVSGIKYNENTKESKEENKTARFEIMFKLTMLCGMTGILITYTKTVLV
jgi:hypothetical protein